jgi:metallo-beta-lactamase class B
MKVRVAAILVLMAAALATLPAQRSSYEPAWNRPAQPHRIIGNVFFVGTNELGTFLIATPRGHILLDPGFDESVPLLKASMRALGFRYEEIRVLLSSQAHFDHAAGLARIKRETGARLEAMREDAALLERGGRDDFRFGNERTFPPVGVDRVLKHGDVVEHGGVRLIAHHTPGHTKGATTFTAIVAEAGWAHQVVFAASTTVNEGTRLVNNTRYPNIVEDWQRTFALLDSLSPGVWVSAHTGFFDMRNKLPRVGKGPNPYIDPVGYRRYLASSRQRFAALLAEELAAPVVQ